MLKLSALVVVARILMLKIRIGDMAAQMRADIARDRNEVDDAELLRRLLVFQRVVGDARPLLRECERLGILPREIGEVE